MVKKSTRNSSSEWWLTISKSSVVRKKRKDQQATWAQVIWCLITHETYGIRGTRRIYAMWWYQRPFSAHVCASTCNLHHEELKVSTLIWVVLALIYQGTYVWKSRTVKGSELRTSQMNSEKFHQWLLTKSNRERTIKSA